MGAVIFLDPATLEKRISASSGLMFEKDATPIIPTQPRTVREALKQIEARGRRVNSSEAKPIDYWGGLDSSRSIFVVATSAKPYPSILSSVRFQDRTFYRQGPVIGHVARLWPYSYNYVGRSNSTYVIGRYYESLQLQRDVYGIKTTPLYQNIMFQSLPPFTKKEVTWGNIQYLNPWGDWEFLPAFVISEQWRRKKDDRQLELLEQVTIEHEEFVMTVGVPRDALTRNRLLGPHEIHKTLSEMLRSYVVYWAWNELFSNWVRVSVLDRNKPIDVQKPYITVQFVLVRDMIGYDTRYKFFEERTLT